mmetsp:Transcript_14475/g.25467  ORF Transcript_14475/g.25467 Transcript_14475/m.25467 type:complete len:992 (+) Transcript_14475:101-3076(+)
MGLFSKSSEGKKDEKDPNDVKTEKGGAGDISATGPVGERGCTDCWCLFVLVAAWLAYLVVTVMGVADGNPAKLYLPRDYAGSYCGAETNWNDGPNLKNQEYLSYTMNLTATMDTIAKKFVCSTAVKSVLDGSGNGGVALLTTDQQIQYGCDCCLDPCKTCTGAYEVGGDLTSVAEANTKIGAMVSEFKGDGSALFASGGENGDEFQNMWSDATAYFNMVCLPACNYTLAETEKRQYVYAMAPDDPLKMYWDLLTANANPVKATIDTHFTFDAMPISQCPYESQLCVPFPGVDFTEQPGGYCSFEMSASVTGSIGSDMASAMVSQGSEALQAGLTSSIGELFGDFLQAIPAFILMAFSSFVVGLVFMVLLRMFVKICTWIAVFAVLFILLIGGGLCYVRSVQCSGAGLFDTGTQMASAVQVAAATAASGGGADETLEGDGAGYRGAQYKTIDGYTCVNWAEGNSAAANYTSADYPDSDLIESYCRNPYHESDENKGATIWCWTTDALVKWQTCRPVGIIAPECSNGYAVSDPTMRKAFEVIGYICWTFAGIYLIIVCLIRDRIRLAVAINEVGAQFVANNPLILLVPIIQAFIGVLWIALWAASASFLLSQVPDGYVEKGVFATYAEAYGTADVPGKCTGEWPTGSVYRDDHRCGTVTEDGAEIPACWRCSPPRYVFDVRFAISFFVFLWNNALNVAAGQCLIAGAVGAWFFTKNDEKGMGMPSCGKGKKEGAAAGEEGNAGEEVEGVASPASPSAASGGEAEEKPWKPGPIRRGAWNLFRYHLGSVAFGAFIIAVIQMIRALLYYYQKQAEAQKNRVMVLVLKVLQCLIWCFEKCVKFLNKNAYIQIALHGTNFCTSAKKAFFLILRNAVRFGTVAILGTMISWIGWTFIIACTVGLGYLYLINLHPEAELAINIVIHCCVAYCAAQVFMNVFGLAVDTSLQCFLLVEELECGVAGPKGFVPKPMERWLNHKGSMDESDDEAAEPEKKADA